MKSLVTYRLCVPAMMEGLYKRGYLFDIMAPVGALKAN